MRPLMLFLVLVLGSASSVLAEETHGPYTEAISLMVEGRVTEAIRLMEGVEETWSDPVALGYLGAMLESDGREDRALEVYLRLLALPFGGREEEVSYNRLMAKAWPVSIGPWKGGDYTGAVAQGRLVAIGSQMGGEAWEKVVEAIPLTGEVEFHCWRDAVAINRMIPAKNGQGLAEGDTEQWFEFLKRQPENRVALKLIIERDLDIDWNRFLSWVLQHCPDLPLGWEVDLRLNSVRPRHPEVLQRWNDFADWVESKDIEELRRLPREVVGRTAWQFAVAPIHQKPDGRLVDFHEPMRRVMDRLIQSTDDKFLEAELRMALAMGLGAFLGPDASGIVEEANTATTVLSELAVQDNPSGTSHWWNPVNSSMDPWEWNNPLSMWETMPRVLAYSGDRPISEVLCEQLDSPVLRFMMMDRNDGEGRMRYLVEELNKARPPLEAAVVRDLRRCFWSESIVAGKNLHEGKYYDIALQDMESAAADGSDPWLALEALARLVATEAVGSVAEPFRTPAVSRNGNFHRFAQLADRLIETSPAARERVLAMVSLAGLHGEDEWKRYFEGYGRIKRHLVNYDEKAGKARVEAGAKEGMYDLVRGLGYADHQWAEWQQEERSRLLQTDAVSEGTAPPDEERGLRILRELHERYPHREEWTMELALRTPNEEEAYRLLDEVMAQGEIAFHAALWSAPSALAANGFGRSGRPTPGMGQRLAQWEKLRRPEGSRRWMRESMVLFACADSSDAMNMMLDGAGTAEHAYSQLRGREFKLGHSREQLPSAFEHPELHKEMLETIKMTEEDRLDMARRVLLSGAYAWDEPPWFNLWGYISARPPTHRYGRPLLTPLPTALSDLVFALETREKGKVFPPSFLSKLKEVDPVTATWLEEMLEYRSALDVSLVPEADWFENDRWRMGSRHPDPFAETGRNEWPPDKPAWLFRTLKFDRRWHDLARCEAGLLRASSLPDADKVPQVVEFREAWDHSRAERNPFDP